MAISVTTIEQLQGDPNGPLSRDTRVRWALKEVGLPYTVNVVSLAARGEPDYRALQPFGQIPVYTEGNLVLSSLVQSFITLHKIILGCCLQIPMAAPAR